MAGPSAPLSNPGGDVAARITQLEDQITQLEKDAGQKDSQGDPTSAAFMAQKALPKLYSEWRQLLTTQRTLGLPNPSARYYDLNTTARYIPKPGAPGTPVLWPEGGVSAAPGAPPDYVENINYDPEQHALELALKQAQINAANRGPVGHDPATAARLAWEQEWEPQKFALEQAAKKEAMAAAYKQFQEEQAAADARNRLTNTTQFTNNLLDTWAKAAPSAMIPGQQQYLGFEPSGPYEQLVRMGGGRYDPNLYRPAPVQIDPAEAWRQAQGMNRGGGG